MKLKGILIHCKADFMNAQKIAFSINMCMHQQDLEMIKNQP